MGHDFNCPHCGAWVGNCGFEDDDHEETFELSTACACGERVTGSCGGGDGGDDSDGGGSGGGSGGGGSSGSGSGG